MLLALGHIEYHNKNQDGYTSKERLEIMTREPSLKRRETFGEEERQLIKLKKIENIFRKLSTQKNVRHKRDSRQDAGQRRPGISGFL